MKTPQPPKSPIPLSLLLYRSALAFYPPRLRRQYRDQMFQTVKDAYQDRQTNSFRFWIHAYRDMVTSSISERIHMLQEASLQRSVVLHTVALVLVLTFVGIVASLTMDQMLRRGADQPQIDMADWYVGEIAAGEAPTDVIPPGYVDLERSLQPMVIFYDDHGRPGPGTGYLDQKLPTLPSGVLDNVRQHGSEKVTWQPRPGVRMASVIRRVSGKTPGFVLAGRSLRLVEDQKSFLHNLAFGLWLTVMVLLFGGAAFLNRASRASQVQL